MKDLIYKHIAVGALQEEINKIKPPFNNDSDAAIRCGIRLAKNVIEDLPTAQSEPEGQWIEALVAGMPAIHHEKCGAFVYAPQGSIGFNFCPYCGAKMKGLKGM